MIMDTTYIKSIENEQDLDKAFARIDQIIDAAPGTEEFEELKVLGDLVYVYEEKHHPIGPPDPVELLKSKIEDGEITKDDLLKIFGGKTQKSLILNKKRRFPPESMYIMIRDFGVPAESFFKTSYFKNFEYKDKRRKEKTDY